MRDLLSEDLKKVEKRYNQQLNYLTVDNEMLALNLKNKRQDYEKLNKQYENQQVINIINKKSILFLSE